MADVSSVGGSSAGTVACSAPPAAPASAGTIGRSSSSIGGETTGSAALWGGDNPPVFGGARTGGFMM